MGLMNTDVLVVYPTKASGDGPRIAKGLTELGQRVSVAHDAAEALRLADRQLPDAIISTELSPPLDAVELCWAIRKTSRVAGALFVVVTERVPTNKRIQGFRTGVDLFLGSPVSVHELASYIRSQVGLRTGVDMPDLILAGHLTNLNLLEVLQFALNSGKSGRLDLRFHSGERARIYVRKGQPSHATFGNEFGRQALQKLARLRDGAFQFVRESHFPEPNISDPAHELILDLARLLDEEGSTGANQA